MHARRATLADADLLARWSAEPHVVAATGGDEAEDWHALLADEPSWSATYIGEVDGRPVGVVCVLDPHADPEHYWGDVPPGLRAIDIWLGDIADAGKGYGTALLSCVLDTIFADPTVDAVLIDVLPTNTRALPFYERLGFTFTARRHLAGQENLIHQLPRDVWLNH